MHEILKGAAAYLLENELVEIISEGYTQAGGGLKATVLGKAVVAASLSTEEGLFVHRELERSMRRFILDDELVTLTTDNTDLPASDIPLYSSVRPMRCGLENPSNKIRQSPRNQRPRRHINRGIARPHKSSCTRSIIER